MKNLTLLDETFRVGKAVQLLRNVFGTLVIGILISSGLSIENVRAEEHATPSKHDMHDMDMHDMDDMKDMPGMEHMDHSAHQKSLSKRGTYSSTVISYTVPDVQLVDSNGKPVSLRDLTDDHSTVLLNFIFTTCTTICPVMTSTFQQVQDKLEKNRKAVRMVSISIDPENDTPARLKEYATKNKAGAHWTFLTGTLENSVLVQKAFGVLAGEKMNHKPITFLKAKGSDKQWVRLEGLAEADQIVNEYEKLDMAGMKHN